MGRATCNGNEAKSRMKQLSDMPTFNCLSWTMIFIILYNNSKVNLWPVIISQTLLSCTMWILIVLYANGFEFLHDFTKPHTDPPWGIPNSNTCQQDIDRCHLTKSIPC